MQDEAHTPVSGLFAFIIVERRRFCVSKKVRPLKAMPASKQAYKKGLSHESNLTYAQPLFLLRESNIHFDEKNLEKNAQERTLYHASFFPAYFYAATSTGKRCCPPHPRWIF